MLNPACYCNLTFLSQLELHVKRCVFFVFLFCFLAYCTVQEFPFLCEPRNQCDLKVLTDAYCSVTGIQLTIKPDGQLKNCDPKFHGKAYGKMFCTAYTSSTPIHPAHPQFTLPLSVL